MQRKAYAYDTDKYNMIYQMNMFKNGVHLKQVLESEKMIPPDQVKKIMELFDQTYLIYAVSLSFCIHVSTSSNPNLKSITRSLHDSKSNSLWLL